uniref:Putative GATA transcription factor 15-like n=1 Tax=Davidia involucrata TaxID=16924 RepID=A0A5B7BWJ2_DAVIN
MMDLKEKESESEIINSNQASKVVEVKKSCSDCNTTSTPLWRGGPAGPKSLCNACGIKYNKKRRANLGLDGGRTEKGKKKKKSKQEQSLKLRLMVLGREMALQTSGKPRRRKLGEEEQAAILLMALSCGSVYA